MEFILNTFYTNVFRNKNNIYVCGYHDGVRFKDKLKYQPYLFLPSNEESEYKTLYGNYAKKINFTSISESREFIAKYRDVSNFDIYGLDSFIYTYIFDNYPGEIAYNPDLISTWYLDIEVEHENGFPDISKAENEITAITIKNNKKIITLGCGEYKKKRKNFQYIKFETEEKLLLGLVKLFTSEEYRPDVITGWNIRFFDIPYLVNRMRLVLGEDITRSISPWGVLNEEIIEYGNKELQTFVPAGITILDYLDIYKKFTYVTQESYSLDHIAWVETGKRKLDYSEYGSLNNLYKQNYELFIDYNIEDVLRVFDIDEKMKLLELVYAIAFDAKVNLADALTSVRLWDVIIHNHLLEKNIVIPKNTRKKNDTFIPGGYVKEPKPGIYDWVVSFDLTSLYPHLIKQFNISPETFVSKQAVYLANDVISNPEHHLSSMKDTILYAQKNNLSLAANGCMYRKDIYGVLPELMRIQFNKRVEYKNKMKEAKKKYEETPTKELKNEISKYHNAQLATKIKINSAYGAVANKYFRYFSADNASAITISGQLVVQWAQRAINRFLNSKLKTTNVDYVIASDTDSVYLNLGNYVSNLNTVQKKVDALDAFCENELQDCIDNCFADLAKSLNAYANEMNMKRELIAEKAFWRGKKNYAAWVWDSEGLRYKKPELKIAGLEAIKSSTPLMCREKLKLCYEYILTDQEEKCSILISEFRKEYFSMTFEEIAFPRSVNGILKYSDVNSVFGKKTPIHVRGSLLYNEYLRKMNLENKYVFIRDKDKIKFCYLKLPNPIQNDVISAPKVLPLELGLNKYIDYQLMFDTSFLSPINSILQIVGWTNEQRNTLESFFE